MSPAEGQNMAGIPRGSIPALILQEGVVKDSIDAIQIAKEWLSQLSSRFKNKDFSKLSQLLIEDCWWRDIIGLAWDYSTKHGHENISKYLTTSPNPPTDMKVISSGALQPALVEMGGMVYIQFGFTFEHIHGTGTGVVKLANISQTEWKAWIVFTTLESLKAQPEEVFDTTNPEARDYDVLIVGAGQSALTLGARLKSLGVRAILVEKEAHLGDSWRARYDSIQLHTPKYTDHYPYMKYSESLPKFLSRNEVADFMDEYAKAMDLNILLNTKVTGVKYIKGKQSYEVEAQTPSGTLKFTPRHVVLATGAFGTEPVIPPFLNMSSFGGRLYHSNEHKSASNIPNVANKKVVIIGASTSAHDIAQDFVSSGAKEVSLIQRGAIFSVSRTAVEAVGLSLWNTPGISTEEADLMATSIPLPVLRTMSIGMTQIMSGIDKEMLAGLRKAGLAVKDGHGGEGIAEHQFIRAGHFYIDQGANEMIIDGRIKILQCDDGIKEFTEDGLVLSDGTKIDADVVVLATGFQWANTHVAKLFGAEVTGKMESFGFLDKEQERGGWWRPTGVPGFWYMTGNFIWSRQFSLVLALQIAAVVRGLNKTYYETQTLLD